MKLYWPMALVLNDTYFVDARHTYEAALTEDQARRQIDIWKDFYHLGILKTWIDVSENGNIVEKIPVEVNPENVYILCDRVHTELFGEDGKTTSIFGGYGMHSHGYSEGTDNSEIIFWMHNAFPDCFKGEKE